MLKLATAVTAALALAVPSSAAGAGFKEPVKVLWQHTGAAGYYFGWAVSPLADVNRDGATDAIIGEPGNRPATRGTTWVYSGRTGAVARTASTASPATERLRHRRRRRPRTATASTTSSAAPRARAPTPRATPTSISGRAGSLLHTFAGEVTGDSFGAAVSSAGDVNRDGRPDLLVGAPCHPGGGMAFVYSGRTFRLLYRIPPPDATHAFGYGTGSTEDVNRDRVPDLIVGGGGTAYVFSGRDGRRLYALPPSAAPRGVRHVLRGRRRRRQPRPRPGRLRRRLRAPTTTGSNSGFAGVYSGRDGTLLRSWTGAAGDGLGPGRGAGDVDGDHRPDLAIGSYLNSDGGTNAGKIELFSGATGAKLRTITSTTPRGEPRLRRRRRRRRQSRPPPRPARLGGRGRHGLHDRREPAALGR